MSLNSRHAKRKGMSTSRVQKVGLHLYRQISQMTHDLDEDEAMVASKFEEQVMKGQI